MVVAIGAVTLIAGAGSAAADGGNHGGRWRKVRVHFQPIITPDSGATEFLCLPSDPVAVDPPAQCVVTSTVAATETGDLTGSVVQATSFGFNGVDTQLPQTAVGTFTGTVTGCGEGGFLYSARGTLDTHTGDQTWVYTIAEGSGSGQLAGITGRFEQSGPVAAPVSGTVRCRPSR